MQSNIMTIYELLDKKKRGARLTSDEIKWFINGVMNKTVLDYQTSAMLMAMFIHELNANETAALTDAMLYSGKCLQFNDPSIVDKHSTGGVGDKTSFILAPIAAAVGVKVPMIAGRGLGHTGGTVDKIEAIKGFRTDLTIEEFSKQLIEKGLVLIGQTKDIAPADKIIYALRDVTATIDSIPLITASIMSKKLAEGASGIVMDIKCGNGAFMQTLPQARKLAKSILQTAKRFDRKAIALITDMGQPLGQAIGNSLEIIECIEVLKGRGPKDLVSLSLELAAQMIFIAGKAKNITSARSLAKKALQNGSALKKFEELITLQGGDAEVLQNYNKLELAPIQCELLSPKEGYIKNFNTTLFGLLCTELGGGRKQKTDLIDFGVGFLLHKKRADFVKKGESLLTIYHNSSQKELVDGIKEKIITEGIEFSKSKPVNIPTILETITL